MNGRVPRSGWWYTKMLAMFFVGFVVGVKLLEEILVLVLT